MFAGRSWRRTCKHTEKKAMRTHSSLTAALSLAAVSIFVAVPAGAQQGSTAQSQQSASQHNEFREEIGALERARQQISQAQPGQITAEAQQALKALQHAEGALKSMESRARQQVAAAQQEIQQARTTLTNQQPTKDAALQAMDQVIQKARAVQQELSRLGLQETSKARKST
jgi:hypothetical protein